MQNPTSFCILHPCTVHKIYISQPPQFQGSMGREGGRGRMPVWIYGLRIGTFYLLVIA